MLNVRRDGYALAASHHYLLVYLAVVLNIEVLDPVGLVEIVGDPKWERFLMVLKVKELDLVYRRL